MAHGVCVKVNFRHSLYEVYTHIKCCVCRQLLSESACGNMTMCLIALTVIQVSLLIATRSKFKVVTIALKKFNLTNCKFDFLGKLKPNFDCILFLF